MQLKYMRPVILQGCATMRAKLAKAKTTSEKEMELQRITKVKKRMKLWDEEGMTFKTATDIVN